MKVLKHEKTGRDRVISIGFSLGFLEKLFRRNPKTTTVRGSSTVWYYYPSGIRCPTWLEFKLHGIDKRLEWQEELLT